MVGGASRAPDGDIITGGGTNGCSGDLRDNWFWRREGRGRGRGRQGGGGKEGGKAVGEGGREGNGGYVMAKTKTHGACGIPDWKIHSTSDRLTYPSLLRVRVSSSTFRFVSTKMMV